MATSLRSALQVSPERIQALDDVGLRDLMDALLHAEGYRCRARQSEISITYEMKARDEGCDGWSPKHRRRAEWMPKGPTCWQFKAGLAGQPNRLRGEAKKRKPKEALQAGGAYVVVASKASGKSAADSRLRQLRKDAGRLPKDQIRVYTCENLASWCNCYPAVGIKHRLVEFPEGLGFLSLQEWLSNPQFAQAYYPSADITDQMEAVRQGLSFSAKGPGHFHLWGPPGVGKTRTALEIIRAKELGVFSVYLPVYDDKMVSLLAQVRSNQGAHLIVVIDETPREALPLLLEQVRLSDGRIRLITIGTSHHADSRELKAIRLDPVGPEVMRKVLREQAPDLPEEHAAFVVRFADGYVKLARIVCDAITADPDIQGLKLLQEHGDIRHLMDRLLGDLSHSIRRALHVVALLSRVGWEQELAKEGQAVAACLGLNWLDVKHQVDQAHQQLAIAPLAGRLRYISPRPLALYLALEAMRSYRDELHKLPEKLPFEASREAFYSRLSELAEFPAASSWVREEIDRFFFLSDLKSDSSARVWSHLALADPVHAAAKMRAILQGASHEEKKAFGEGRREIVWALVKLAWRKDSFEDAMLALAELAVAESESFSNNATGEFCARFQVVLGGTEVPYPERLAVVDQLLRHTEPGYQTLAIRALSQVAIMQESRLCHGEYHGVHSVNSEWHPDVEEDRAARREALQRLTNLARHKRADLEKPLAAAAHDVLPLLTHGGLPSEVSELVKAVAATYPGRKEALRRDVAERLELSSTFDERVPQQVLDSLVALHGSLIDLSAEGRLRQFVGRQRWDTSEPPPALLQLADEFVANTDLVGRHFAWLTSGKAENAWEFGRLLGEKDRESKLLDRLTSSADRGSDLRVTCAYLAAQAVHQSPGWLDEWLDSRLKIDPQDDELVLEGTWRAKASERGVRRIVDLLRRGHLTPERFACLAYSNWTAVLDVAALSELLGQLISHPKLRPTALVLLRQRLHQHAEEVQQLGQFAVRLVCDPELVLDSRSPAWSEVASLLIPTHAREVARAIMTAHASGNGVIRFSLAAKMLHQCAERDPLGLWSELVPYLEDDNKASLFIIGFPEAIIDALPQAPVLEWASESPDRRASLLARLSAPDFTRDDSLASKLADLYGDREGVSSALFAQLTTAAVKGSLADHWAGLAAQMEQVSRTSRLHRLRRWARQARERLRNLEARRRDYEAERELEMSLR